MELTDQIEYFDPTALPADTTIRFFSLASGSSGNCYYLGCNGYGILIDAGIGIRTIRKVLKENDILPFSVRAVFITHDHADHIKAVGHLGEKLHIPIYATARTHEGISHSYCVTQKLSSSIRFVEKGVQTRFSHFFIEPFEVSHDGIDNVGYHISIGDIRMTFLTDLGVITESVASYIRKSNYLVLEANYDEEMLQMGPYPAYLKGRIASKTGHLSNKDAAECLVQNITPELKHIWLCHLSKENNHPELAYKTIECRLKAAGINVGKDVQLTVLKRTTPSEMYELK